MILKIIQSTKILSWHPILKSAWLFRFEQEPGRLRVEYVFPFLHDSTSSGPHLLFDLGTTTTPTNQSIR